MEITLLAQKYFVDLLLKQEAGVQLRVFVLNAGTLAARGGVCYAFPGAFSDSDIVIEFDLLSVRVDRSFIPFLKDAVIDILVDGLNNKIVFSAPYMNNTKYLVASQGEDKFNTDLSLEDKIRNVIRFQINPQLSLHGGSVSLLEITKDFLVILKFSGGCNGCAMAKQTLQLGIETTLKKIFPELRGVRDITNHKPGSHSFY